MKTSDCTGVKNLIENGLFKCGFKFEEQISSVALQFVRFKIIAHTSEVGAGTAG